eukprot:336683-Pleurochrysis_carterae.AAC.1
MVRLNSAHQSGVHSAVPGVNGRNTRVGHQEFLGEGELVANALVDAVSRRKHVLLIGIVVQAIKERVERR